MKRAFRETQRLLRERVLLVDLSAGQMVRW